MTRRRRWTADLDLLGPIVAIAVAVVVGVVAAAAVVQTLTGWLW